MICPCDTTGCPACRPRVVRFGERVFVEGMHTVRRAEKRRIEAEAARDAALARDRARFDEKWSHFWKCTFCGARLDPPKVPCLHGHFIATGYGRRAAP